MQVTDGNTPTKKVTLFERTIIKYYLKFESSAGDVRIGYSDIIDILDELGDCDGLFTAMVIYDDNIAKVLVEYGAAEKTTKGSYRRGKNFQTFFDMLIELKK